MEDSVLAQEIATYKIRIAIMEDALSASAGAYYNINLTQNCIPGIMYQVIDGKKYSINEAIGLPSDCAYWDVIEYWGNQLSEDQKASYFDFFSIENLAACFKRGQEHVVHTYRTKDSLGEPMIAEQHVVMYEDVHTGDLMAITYVVDRTQVHNLEAENANQGKLLRQDFMQIEGLASQYFALYYLDFDNNECTKYDFDANGAGEFRKRAGLEVVSFLASFREKVIAHTQASYLDEVLSFTYKENLCAALLNKKRHTLRFQFENDKGEYQWIELVLVKLGKAEDEPVDILVAFLDIDAEEREKETQQKALIDALAAAEHANRAKTAFLNNMSHDIRTPMNAIIGYTALAASRLDNPEVVRDYLNKISVSSNHLLSLINDVLDMSRIESGRVKIEEKDVHLPDIFHDLRTIIQSNIAAKQQSLFIDTQDVVHEDIVTDKLRLNQVLLNIVSNAIKFTPVGGMISIRVTERPCSLDGYVTFEFSVKDNGIGMSPEFKEHIFESFTREQTSTVSGIQGTGLGMAITSNIVEMMGGTITVESEEGKGSEFTVVLDCRVSNMTVKYEPIPELQGARALVADDDTDTCMSVSKMLKQIGMRADWTVSGKEAVIRAREAFDEGDAFKAFIIDWLMPDMNGVETVRRIRKVIGDTTPIIILTAYDWSDIENEAREAGVTAFVMKPLFMSELRDVLSQPMRVQSPAVKAVPTKEDFAGKRVLLVEDNMLNQEIAKTILEEAGLEVDTADDGIFAVEKMADSPADRYDLILMDIQMPQMNGFVATREIRTLADNRKANIPIVAMTANAFEEDKKAAFEAGMNGFLAKPIDIQEVLRTLAELLD